MKVNTLEQNCAQLISAWHLQLKITSMLLIKKYQ